MTTSPAERAIHIEGVTKIFGPAPQQALAALRGGTLLKITVQDTNKRTINIDVPLLGFGLAYDKMIK